MVLHPDGERALIERLARPRGAGADFEALRACVEERSLRTEFQPILELRSGRVFGYEALSRGPQASPIESAAELFGLAERAGFGAALERIAARLALERFGASGAPGRIFLNFSPAALEAHSLSGEELLGLLHSFGLAPKQVVIELTEGESFIARSAAWRVLYEFRSLGFGIAIDDLGEGFASLRLWSELRPEYVKIDRHFIDGISADPLKLQMVRAIQQVAQISGSTVIAEGIEHAADFIAVRDLGIRLGQGYFIARPAPLPEAAAARRAWAEMSGLPITVFPEPVGPVSRATARKLLRRVDPVAPDVENDAVFARFEADPDLGVIPVVEGPTPRGLINRLAIVDRFARPYRRELFGKRRCAMFMNPNPVIADIDAPLQIIGYQLADAGQQALADGFIVTEEGRYAGVGAGHELMREITEMQITAARYANPLTLLPGNVPIAQHIERLLTQACRFAACYCDLDFFKPYNDIYGYQRGDAMIQLTARTLSEACDTRVDFLGHVGGDDFMLIFQSADWESRCRQALAAFDARVRALFSPEDLARGAFVAEDRRGRKQRFPLTSLSIGVVTVEPGGYASQYEISAAAAEAKKQAKRSAGSSLLVERRRGAGVRSASAS